MKSLEEIDALIAITRSRIQYHRTNQQCREAVLRNLDKMRETVIQLQRQIAEVERSLEHGPEEIEKLKQRLADLRLKRQGLDRGDARRRLLELAAQIEEMGGEM